MHDVATQSQPATAARDALYALEVTAKDRLDGGLHGLGAGVIEEYAIGKRLLAKKAREFLLLQDSDGISYMPELHSLTYKHVHQFGMQVAEARDRDAAREIKILNAIRAGEPCTIAVGKSDICAGKTAIETVRTILPGPR